MRNYSAIGSRSFNSEWSEMGCSIPYLQVRGAFILCSRPLAQGAEIFNSHLEIVLSYISVSENDPQANKPRVAGGG